MIGGEEEGGLVFIGGMVEGDKLKVSSAHCFLHEHVLDLGVGAGESIHFRVASDDRHLLPQYH